MEQDEKYLTAIKMLKEKSEQLGRLPVRADFAPEEVCFIKQKLGPWSRALEAAGLKTPPAITSKEKSRIKRNRSAKNRREMRRIEKYGKEEQK